MRMLVWRKLASAKWEDAWLERLAFLGPTRLCVVALPSQKSLRIEAFNLTRKEGANLVEQFGGKLYEVKDKPVLEPPPRKPLPIRNALLVVDSPKAAEAARRAGEKGPVIIIPAAMAFGTGEHATTASCLRLLADLAAKTFRDAPWDFNDLGTGSGILAIAAKKLGARKVEGCDFDPHAVRTARENVALNNAAPLPIRKTDVLKWTPNRTWHVVAANLFSEVLIQASATIADAVAEGGYLILSGILREQEAGVVAAFRKRGFSFSRAVRKGKWVALLASKTAVVKQTRQKTR